MSMNEGSGVFALSELREGMLLQSGRDLYKVSTVYDNDDTGGYFTAVLVVQDGGSPGRTRVLSFRPESLVQFKAPGEAIMRQYEQVYDLPPVRR